MLAFAIFLIEILLVFSAFSNPQPKPCIMESPIKMTPKFSFSSISKVADLFVLSGVLGVKFDASEPFLSKFKAVLAG